ncbi:hypothetical protein [Sphingobium sp. SYK-6]|uniref:hypothetical protein n=1 Tax=Sphingobium sp. (strain NBRC 103272 / SYK-6) TaxID=627192 RepID=UPI0002FB8B22|nr:hypothetical protein [Sphingobium sp. SYK-6]
MFYAFGSLLFMAALVMAPTLMAREFARSWRQALAALRTLNVDGWSGEDAGKGAQVACTPLAPVSLQAATIRARQAAA